MAEISIISKIVSRSNGKAITAGKSYSGSGGSSIDISSKLDKSIWDAVFYTDENGNLRVKTNLLGEMSISQYKTGEGTNLPSIYDGLPIDNISLYWDNGVLKSKGSDGMDEGKLKTYLDSNAYINNGNKSNYLPAWALAANKPAYTWTEIGDKPTWIGVNKPSYVWTEIGGKPSWIGDNKPTYAFSEIGGKPTTLGDYGITDAVTLATDQTINGAKTFGKQVGFSNNNSALYPHIYGNGSYLFISGKNDINNSIVFDGNNKLYPYKNGSIDCGSSVNRWATLWSAKGDFSDTVTIKGGVLDYDNTTKVWKITGNLLVTGGITAYGDILTGSAILDALPVDATLSKANGVLSVVGGGFLSSITVKLGTVAYDSVSGVVSLPAYPTTLPASDVPAWAKASSKPGYSWTEIGGKPTTFAPSAHGHAISEVTGLQGVLDGKALTSHTHNYASTVKVGATGYNSTGSVISLPEYPTALKSPNALTISLNGASQGAYDGSAAKSFNINYSNVGAPSTTGANASGTWSINISGDANTLDGYHAAGLYTVSSYSGGRLTNIIGTTSRFIDLYNAHHNAGAQGGVNGYLKVATITISGAHQNQPLTFKITQRGRKGADLTILFNNSGTAGATTLNSFFYTGELTAAYLINSTTGTVWDLYIQKEEAYGNIAISLQSKGSYMSGTSITWKDEFVSSVSGGAAATYWNPASHLFTARTIWGQSFNGQQNVSGTLNGVADINMSGRVSIGSTLYASGAIELYGGTPYIDFHFNNSSTDYTSRIVEPVNGRLSIPSRLSVGNFSNDGYALAVKSFISNDWVRTNGNTGWYSQTYGGGIHMDDSTYVKVFGGKRFFSASGFTVNYGGDSWISMATRTNCIVANQNNSGVSAHALFRTTFSNGNVLAYGGLGNEMGFYGFTASDVANNVNTTSWSTKWNSVGDFVTSKKIAAGNNIYAHGQAYAHSWNTVFNPINSTYGDTELNTVSHNQYKPMIGWHDQISGQGFITKYNIGSYRTNYKWGQMVLAVSSNDYGNTRGAALNINGDGTVTIEGNLLVTGGITQYSNGISTTDTFSANTLKANNCLLIGTNTVLDASTRYINCMGKTGYSYIAFGTSNSQGNSGELAWRYIGDNHGDNLLKIGANGYNFADFFVSGNHIIHNNLRVTGSFSYVSDVRKKNIVRFIDYLSIDQIANAPIFDFIWKESKDLSINSGTSAQYWKEIFPNSVKTWGDSYSIDGSTSLVCNIVIARELQKLKQENEELRQEINQLKERAS